MTFVSSSKPPLNPLLNTQILLNFDSSLFILFLRLLIFLLIFNKCSFPLKRMALKASVLSYNLKKHSSKMGITKEKGDTEFTCRCFFTFSTVVLFLDKRSSTTLIEEHIS